MERYLGQQESGLKKIAIGGTGMAVTELCHGTLILGRLQADLSPAEGARAIRRSYDLGVNFYDAARSYGTYAHLAAGLHGVPRDRVVIASKSHARSHDAMKADVEECLRELSLDRVGIFELHLVSSGEDLRGRQGALDCLRELRDAGLIGAVGASTHTIAGVEALNAEPDIEVIFPVLNVRGLGIIDGNLDGMLEALRESRRRSRFVYAMKPLGGGHLASQAEDCFRYLRELPQCDAVCVGMKAGAEVELNAAIFEDVPVSRELRNRVRAVERKLTIYDRCNGCGLCVAECDQGALRLVDGRAVVDMPRCILCGYCAAVCPEYVIRVV